jgi:hypothetical protein
MADARGESRRAPRHLCIPASIIYAPTKTQNANWLTKGISMNTPTIASPARMSESTYNKFTVRLPYVATNNLTNSPVIA